MNKTYFLLIILVSLISFLACNSQKNTITKIEILDKEFNFGKASLKDTIVHTFKIKNLTNTKLKVNNLATSCGCTTIGKIDSIANKNEIIEVKLQFIPKKEQIGNQVTNSVVVEMNTEPPFTVLRLKGKIN